MKESFNKKTDRREGKKVRRLHADLSGIHSTSVRGYRYFLVVSCDASRTVWIKNRAPTSDLPYGDQDLFVSTSITPFRAFTGQHPDFKHLKVFGCKAVPLKVEENLSSFEPRIREGPWIFIGMDGQHIWKVLNTQTLTVVRTTDCRFDEYVFPDITSSKIRELEIESQALKESRRQKRSKRTQDRVTGDAERPQLVKEDARVLQDPDPARPTGEARARDITPDTIIIDVPAEVAEEPAVATDSPVRDLSNLRKKVKRQIKAREADGAESKVWPTQETVESPYRLRSKTKLRTEFSDSIVKMVKALSVVKLEEEEGESVIQLSRPHKDIITLQQAMRENPLEWQASLRSELEALIQTGTFKIIRGRPPSGISPRSCKIVLRDKFEPDGTVGRRKSRVVIRGFEQEWGVDYYETFASVVRYDTLRALLAKAAIEDLEIDPMDVDTAFLNTHCEEEIYMRVPDHFDLVMPGITKDTHYLQLLKSLYGLKQAPRAWFEMVKKEFHKLGLRAGDSDPNLFIGGGVYILLFVDDMLVIGKRKQVDEIKAEISKIWKCQDKDTANIFVGFQIERDRANRSLRIHQGAYTLRLLEKLGMANCNPRDLPIAPGTVLLSTEQDIDRYDEVDDDQAAIYRTIVGSVIYLSNCTRPDISYTVGQLSRMMARSNTNHLSTAKQLLRYLNGSRTLGITYESTQLGLDYTLWSDATWGTEDDRKSFQGHIMIRHHGAISWTACRQKSTSQSSMEAEICAGSEAGKDAAWMEKLVRDLDETTSTSIPILRMDNSAAEELSKTWKFHSKAKHIEIREMFLRNDMVLRNRLIIEHVPSKDNIADTLTKQLPKEAFRRHIQGFGMSEKQ